MIKVRLINNEGKCLSKWSCLEKDLIGFATASKFVIGEKMYIPIEKVYMPSDNYIITVKESNETLDKYLQFKD